MNKDEVEIVLNDIQKYKPTMIILHYLDGNKLEFNDVDNIPSDTDWLKLKCIERVYEFPIIIEGDFGKYKICRHCKIETKLEK